VRAGDTFFACFDASPPLALGTRRGAAGPTQFHLGFSRIVYADERCSGEGRAMVCSTRLMVARLADRRVFVRHRFEGGGPVSDVAISPRGALAVMVGGRCPAGTDCAPAQLYLMDARGPRVAAEGAGLDTRSLAAAGRTVYWRMDGRTASAQLSG